MKHQAVWETFIMMTRFLQKASNPTTNHIDPVNFKITGDDRLWNDIMNRMQRLTKEINTYQPHQFSNLFSELDKEITSIMNIVENLSNNNNDFKKANSLHRYYLDLSNIRDQVHIVQKIYY